MRSDDVLRLLIIETSLEEAEHLLSTLRNAGIAVRPSSAEDEDELQGVLERQPLDIVLVNTAHELIDVAKAVDAVTRLGKDVPVVALIDEFSADEVVKALEAGAADAVCSESPEHIEAVIRREVNNLAQRRRARMLETSLRETEKRCHALLDSSRDAIAYVHEGMHVYANPAYLQLFDYDSFEEMEGLPILDMVVGDDAGKLRDVLKLIAKGDSPPEDVAVRLNLPDGKIREALMEFSPASIEGEPCTQLVLRDKSVDRELAQELRDLKTQDLVTGVHNRQHMIQSITAAISRTLQERAIHSVIIIEIDGFKRVLEQVGLAGVDLVLGDVAKVISGTLGDSDTVGRMGDQSFVVLCEDQGLEYGKQLAEKVRKAVEDSISEVGDQSIPLTVSCGVTRVSEAVANAHDLMSMASSAAHQASEEGGNRVSVHDPAKVGGKETDDSLQWIERVKHAVQNDRFMLVYQPIVSLHGSEDRFFEVLLRMKGEGDEEIAAGQFMPHIAGHDLMIKVDQWVIQHAVMALKEQRDAAPDASTLFFVKLSVQTLSRPEVLPWIAKVLQKYRLGGDALIFEAPESKLMTNLKPARQFLKGLRQLHCKFAIEQFGSGLNSFQILKHVPADYLKIDRAFMKNLPRNEENQARVKEITEQAHAMGKTTIAEFVEDAASMSILWQCGVNFVQGNFLQEPEKILSYDFA